MNSSLRSLAGCLAVLGACLVAAPAPAGYLTSSYAFTQSNVLADGVNYGTVTIEAYDGIGAAGGGLAAGQVRLTVNVTAAPYATVGPNFGVQSFGFGFQKLRIASGDIDSAPTGWRFDVTPPDAGGFGPFGKFDAAADGAGNDRRAPLVIVISNQGADATTSNVTHANARLGVLRRARGGLHGHRAGRRYQPPDRDHRHQRDRRPGPRGRPAAGLGRSGPAPRWGRPAAQGGRGLTRPVTGAPR